MSYVLLHVFGCDFLSSHTKKCLAVNSASMFCCSDDLAGIVATMSANLKSGIQNISVREENFAFTLL